MEAIIYLECGIFNSALRYVTDNYLQANIIEKKTKGVEITWQK